MAKAITPITPAIETAIKGSMAPHRSLLMREAGWGTMNISFNEGRTHERPRRHACPTGARDRDSAATGHLDGCCHDAAVVSGGAPAGAELYRLRREIKGSREHGIGGAGEHILVNISRFSRKRILIEQNTGERPGSHCGKN